uniref:Diterpene synthase class I n=1 Tax=Scutellaria barbata TaxID=396367 RepID=A0A6B7LPD6_9LAMI|nr:diterpene synthase class I [Scutellaria barbata]UNZ11785.1 diterpene synthase class I [Scutellaria barbata]
MSVGYSLRIFSLSSSATESFRGRRRVLSSTKCSLLNVSTINQNLIEKIRERINNGKVEISPSAYDTAWVAMVPSRDYSGVEQPCFPQCVDWITENQNSDGSWGLNPGHPHLVKDSLSCTLACLLALRKWDTGHQLIQRGLDFIVSNDWAASTGDKDQFSPIGFDIIFPAMLNYANDMGLTLPFTNNMLDSLLHFRDSQLRTLKQEYISEALGSSCNWNEIILTHQRKNGSLFNSPATTAAALIHCPDDKCYQYLISVLEACNGWVPTIYPMNIYARLCMVDTLERLGVARYFGFELSNILDEIYRCWQEKEEEIFSDITCHAMAFRLLRMKGYNVSSDELAEFVDQEHFFSTVNMQYSGVTTVLELYRASQIRIYEDESTLDKIHAWTKGFLTHQLLNQAILDKQLQKQVEYDLKNHVTPDRFRDRRNIELYGAQDFQMAKTAYRCLISHNEDFILFSMDDYSISQTLYQREFQEILRWYAETRLDSLNQGRNVVLVSYALNAAVTVDSELSYLRIFNAKHFILTTSLDDFVDDYGSKEEVFYIIELVKKWQRETTYSSEQVEILFTALYNTVNEVAEKAFSEQGFSVKHELISMWLEYLTYSVREKNSWSDNNVSSLDEYLSFAWKNVNSAMIFLMSIQFYGIKLSKEIFTSAEFTNLCGRASLVGRLLNDLKTHKKEKEENLVNSVSVQTAGGGISEEEAILNVEQIVEYNTRKVLKMVCEREGSIIPRECKQLFWKICQIAYFLYPQDGGDEFSSPKETAKEINALIWDPIHLPPIST